MKVMSNPAMASPCTNFDAPSMAPKKSASRSRFLRRLRAVSASMAPEERSASTAICLPGMASRVKRAATSATRPAPLVITMKLITAMMRNITRPTSTLPSTTKRPKASTTEPAAPAPSAPCSRISRVVATFSDRRSSVATSTNAGNALNSRASSMKRAVRKTPTERAMLKESSRSSSAGGSGRTIISTMPMIPRGTSRSRRRLSVDAAVGAFTEGLPSQTPCLRSNDSSVTPGAARMTPGDNAPTPPRRPRSGAARRRCGGGG